MDMSSSTGFRFDSLLHSLRELQNEKQCLEQRLNERKLQVQNLEKKIDQSNATLSQVKETYQKMVEMEKVSVQKVNQTQVQIDNLQDINQGLNERIKEINAEIQAEKDRGLQNQSSFEKQMAALAEQMVTARKFYKTDALQQKIKEIQEKIQENESADEISEREVNLLAQTMEHLQLQSSESNQGNEVPQEARRLLWSMLEREDMSVSEALERLQAEQHEICALLQELDASQAEK